MTTAIPGTGGLGSVIARQFASGGEALRLSSADNASARRESALTSMRWGGRLPPGSRWLRGWRSSPLPLFGGKAWSDSAFGLLRAA
jgi:hypothetical protein